MLRVIKRLLFSAQNNKRNGNLKISEATILPLLGRGNNYTGHGYLTLKTHLIEIRCSHAPRWRKMAMLDPSLTSIVQMLYGLAFILFQLN